ncbi:helix-turn-helix domain-containing protein [Stappia indica]|uniref:Helix-turn-helix domain-containing protein n=1 Tax=Stappia indica TaxID=538381 RepID=A0A857C4D0_9HYPH|nr:helix-turn-helix domain-containing protein [Stappia indica]
MSAGTWPACAKGGQVDASEGIKGPTGIGALVGAAVRRERLRAGLSASELARAAGLAKSTLSQLESGSGNPAIETLWLLANALGVSVAALLEAPRGEIEVIRAGEGPSTRSDHADYLARLLSAAGPGTRRDLYVIEAEPGSPHLSAAHLSPGHGPGTREHVVVMRGRARLGPEGREVELAAGDYAAYPADTPHTFEALEPDTRAVLIIEHG